MNLRHHLLRSVFLLFWATFLTSGPVLAYGGPGSIVSGVGALLAALAAIGAAIFGFLWFPVKRLMKKLRDEGEETPEAGELEESLAEE